LESNLLNSILETAVCTAHSFLQNDDVRSRTVEIQMLTMISESIEPGASINCDISQGWNMASESPNLRIMGFKKFSAILINFIHRRIR